MVLPLNFGCNVHKRLSFVKSSTVFGGAALYSAKTYP